MTSTVNGTTTYFIGAHYEVTGSQITKYYYAGAQRVAMRIGSTLNYLLGDHLGSTSIVTSDTGALVMETRYKPWGEVRFATASQTLPTRYTYTGQYSYINDEATDLGSAGFGLMFYNARWYDPYLNHFTQPDTIVPDQYNSQDWDRYSYARNNPIRYTDPTGHDVDCGIVDPCEELVIQTIESDYDWTLEGIWSLEEVDTIYQTGRAIETYINGLTDGNGLEWMLRRFGNVTIRHGYFEDGHSDTLPFLGENLGSQIRLNTNWLTDGWGANVVFAHELGHVWDINSSFAPSYLMNLDLGGSGVCLLCAPGSGVPTWGPSYHYKGGDAYGNSGRNEYFAEAFAAAIYNRETHGVVSSAVAWIDSNISTLLYFNPWTGQR